MGPGGRQGVQRIHWSRVWIHGTVPLGLLDILHSKRPPTPQKFSAVGASTRQTILKWYLLIVLIEVLAIFLALILANRLHRADLAPDWSAMIVGLHFLPLAKIFRAPRLFVLGILMMLWCALSWALFRSNTIAISASLGTGILLWALVSPYCFEPDKSRNHLKSTDAL